GRPCAAAASAARRRNHFQCAGGNHGKRPVAHRQGVERAPRRGQQLPLPEHVQGAVHGQQISWGGHFPNKPLTPSRSSCNSWSVFLNFSCPTASSFTPSATVAFPLPSLRQG